MKLGSLRSPGEDMRKCVFNSMFEHRVLCSNIKSFMFKHITLCLNKQWGHVENVVLSLCLNVEFYV